jgi:hypothetical protein
MVLDRRQYARQAAELRGATPEEMKNQDVSVDLKESVDPEVELLMKQEFMRVREIVLEQDRLLAVVRDKFAHLQDPEVFSYYCDSLGLEKGVAEDLRAAIPRMIELFAKGDAVFSEQVLQEEAESFEQIYLALGQDAKQVFSEAQMGETIAAIMNAEIDLAIQVLSENKARKRLSHRERGFSADEASVQALESALAENIGELEFDIRVSKDQRCIIHHNSTLGESADRPEHIKDLTVEELSEVRYKGGEEICTLERLFRLIEETGNTSTKINIDIKDFDEQALDEILQLIHDYNMEHRVAIVSWLPQSLQYLYEKDPTLEYSMSYFPVIRGIPEVIIKAIENIPSGTRVFGAIGTAFAKLRAGTVQGVGAENITDATVLQGNEHWTDTMERVRDKEEDLVGRHTVPHAELPVADMWGDMDVLARVLQGGSVNIMALEPVVERAVEQMCALPVVGRMIAAHKQEFIKAICATDSMLAYAKQLQTNGVKVNIYDIKKEGQIDRHVSQMREAGVEPGVVYYSGEYEGLHTRGRIPEIPSPTE